MFAHLVVAAVFKTVGRCVDRIASGFDSHTLPPFWITLNENDSTYLGSVCLGKVDNDSKF